MRHCDVFKCSLEEAQALVGDLSPIDAAQTLHKHGAVLAIVTDGPHGAGYATSRFSGHANAPDVQVVDTTGAGDAFMSGLLFRLLTHNINLKTCTQATLHDVVSFACEIGAAAVTELGAVAGIPHGEPTA